MGFHPKSHTWMHTPIVHSSHTIHNSDKTLCRLTCRIIFKCSKFKLGWVMRHIRWQSLYRIEFMTDIYITLCLQLEGHKKLCYATLFCHIALIWQVTFSFSVNFSVFCLFSSILVMVRYFMRQFRRQCFCRISRFTVLMMCLNPIRVFCK